MNKEGIAYRLLTIVLRVALVATLVFAGWTIYRGLPSGTGGNLRRPTETAETLLQINLRNAAASPSTPLDVPVELYPIDIAAAQREYFFEKRPGKRLELFLQERMNGRAPVKARFNQKGEASVVVPQGSWWIHVTLVDDMNIEWRLHVNVFGRQQTVDLTTENAYLRTKSF